MKHWLCLTINNVIWTIRIYIFQKIFGINILDLKKLYSNQIVINKRLKTFSLVLTELHAKVDESKQIALDAISMTGGPGWTHTMQAAIKYLNNNLEHMSEVVMQHQQNLSVIVAERNELAEAADQVPKKQLN